MEGESFRAPQQDLHPNILLSKSPLLHPIWRKKIPEIGDCGDGGAPSDRP